MSLFVTVAKRFGQHDALCIGYCRDPPPPNHGNTYSKNPQSNSKTHPGLSYAVKTTGWWGIFSSSGSVATLVYPDIIIWVLIIFNAESNQFLFDSPSPMDINR